jgi:hypothetical protein
MMRVCVSGIGVAAPGIGDWTRARAVIAGGRAGESTEITFPPPAVLSGAERRRSPQSVRLALHVAEQARVMSGLDAREIAAVFGSCIADGAVTVRTLETLSDEAPYVSPTDFHNSVHNEAVGYWAIGAGSHQPATSIGAGDDTFAASLLKAAMQTLDGGRPVLLCVYDIPFPEPLRDKLPMSGAFGAALVLEAGRSERTIAGISLEVTKAGAPPARPAGAHWRALFDDTPAARCIPLLERLANPGDAGALVVGKVGGCILSARVSQ